MFIDWLHHRFLAPAGQHVAPNGGSLLVEYCFHKHLVPLEQKLNLRLET